jgi:hypothetical protein
MEQDNVKNGDFKKVNDFKEYGVKLLKKKDFNNYSNISGENVFDKQNKIIKFYNNNVKNNSQKLTTNYSLNNNSNQLETQTLGL